MVDGLQVANAGLLLYSLSKQAGIDTSDVKKQADDIKNKTDTIIENTVLTNATDGIVGNNMVSAQIMKSSNSSIDQAVQDAIANDLSIINMTNCIKTLKAYYNLTESDNLIIVKKDTDPSIANNTGSKQVQVDVYTTNRTKLNISICENDHISVKIPILNKSTEGNKDLNLTRYSEIKKSGVDIFDPNDSAFTSRCYNYTYNGYDTTVNSRRQLLYSNTSIQCSDGCSYTGVDENNYAECDCQGKTEKVQNNIVDIALGTLTSFNFEIVSCSSRLSDVYN
jgi:hypothetical protein